MRLLLTIGLFVAVTWPYPPLVKFGAQVRPSIRKVVPMTCDKAIDEAWAALEKAPKSDYMRVSKSYSGFSGGSTSVDFRDLLAVDRAILDALMACRSSEGRR